MPIDEKDITIFGGMFAFIGTVLGFGRAYGQLATRVKGNEDDIIILKQKFLTADGEPRLMSFAAHDNIKNACEKLMEERNRAINARLDRHDKKLDAILKAVSTEE